jgi:hypothetical protein
MKITIPYKPRNWAKALHNTKKRWIVINAHRRCGKTTASINHLIRSALLTKKSRYAYIAPTYKQAKNVAWDMLKEYSWKIPDVKFNEAELRVDFPNGSRITLYGAENVDGLRGIALWGVVFDEYSQQPGNIFSEVVSKCLADHYGYAIWIATPKGKNEFYRVYQTAVGSEDWLGLQITIDDSLKQEEGEVIDNLKMALEDDKKLIEEGVMTIDEFNQEWYASFDTAVKGAYYAEPLQLAREEGRITKVPHEPMLPVYTAWDIGMKDYTAIGFFQVVGHEVRMIDYLEESGHGLEYYIKEVKKRPYIYEEHLAPHDITVREFTAGGRSRLEIAESLGIDFTIVEKHSVQDGIDATRSFFTKLWIDEIKCEDFVNALASYTKKWDDKLGKFLDKPNHDWTSHAADMLRTFVMGFDFFNREEKDEDFEPVVTDY